VSGAARRARRGVAAGAAFVFLAIAIAWIWRNTAGRTTGPLILVSVDTLRADHLPIHGYQAGRTPAIAALAGDGVVFENAYAHAPQTLPSHVSILSGRLPFEHGVRDNLGFTVKADEMLLSSILREAGFATGGFVSAYVLREETGIGRGFDRFDARLPPSSPEVAVGELQRSGVDTLTAADQWLDTLTSRRFFLFFHIYEPHSPYTPPPRFSHFAPYDGEIAHADEIVGSLVASLKRRGLYDDALIVFLSDHGEGLGDHGEQEHGLFLYRETIRVPLIVKLPHQRGAGRRVGTPVQHIDLVPTVLDWFNLPAIPPLRGRSLRTAFTGGLIPEQGLYAEALYSRYHFGWSELYALTDARYSLIRAPRDELYDLEHDPQQRNNLASARESTRIAMGNTLDRLIAGAPIGAPGAVSDDARERLRALGYVGVAPTSAASRTTLPDPKDKVQVLEQYRAAVAHVRKGDPEAALTQFRGIVAMDPVMADVWSEIGGLELRLGRPEAALGAYKRLVEVAPHDPAALISVAETLLALGRVEEARAQATLAAETIPLAEATWRARAHQTLAMVALAQRDHEAARLEARRANEIDRGLPVPEYVEGLIRYQASQFEEAVPHLQAAFAASASRSLQIPGLRYHLGDALARVERYAEAEPPLKEEVRLFPNELRAHAALAMLYRATGRGPESDREVEEIERLPSKDARAMASKLRAMFRGQ
jgi:tetratricopeptide (TPR) repeat protein